MHPLLTRWIRLRDHLSTDLFGGPRPLKLAHVINAQKGGTLPFVLALMWCFGCDTPTAWTYAALHGSYGLIWLMKDLSFPDPGWQRRVTIGGAASALGLVLLPYWLAPVIITAQRVEAPTWLLAAATLVYAVGVSLMLAADAQKYYTLAARRGLITTGLFSRTRNPNYLGEMMVYGSFAALSMHWAPWAVLAWVWLGLFLPNMLQKDASMSRYPEFAAWRARTGLLLPRLGRPAEAASHDARTLPGGGLSS